MINLNPTHRVRFLACIAMLSAHLTVPGTAILQSAQAVPADSGSRPRIGLVLSGGGARGAAHVGVIKKLEELRVPIDAIAGTSMGAIIGGFYAAGLNGDEIEEVLGSIEWSDALRDNPPRTDLSFRRKQDDNSFLVKFDLGVRNGRLVLPRGLLQGQRLNLILRAQTLEVAGIGHFDELPTRFRAVATDIENGQSVVLADGELAEAMRASMSAPGIFAPVEIAGRLLVDGGIANNLPIDVMRELDVDVIIAVDIAYPLLNRDQLDSSVSISGQILTILVRRHAEQLKATLSPEDILIEPQLGEFGSTDFHKSLAAVPLGELATEAIAGRLERLALPPVEYARYVAVRESRQHGKPVVDFVRVAQQDSRLSDEVIRSRINIEAGKPFSADSLGTDLSRIYGLGAYELVDYTLVGEGGRSGLQINARGKSWGPNYLRFGMSLENNFEGTSDYTVSVRHTKTELSRLGAEWRNDVQFGGRSRFFSELYLPLSAGRRFFVAPQIELGERDTNVFSGGANIGTYRVREFSAGVDAGLEFGNWGELRVGIRRDHGTTDLRTGDGSDPSLQDFDFDTGGYFFRFAYDRIDQVSFPRSGSAWTVQWQASRPSLGADASFDLIETQWLGVHSWGKNSLLAEVELNTTSGVQDQIQHQFSLGGFLSLSGLQRDQLAGPHAGIARLVYYRRLGETGGGLFDLPFYAGMSLEAGNVWQNRRDAKLDSLLYSGSLFVGLDTFIGPLYLGAGLSETGDAAVYMFLGQTFRRSAIR